MSMFQIRNGKSVYKTRNEVGIKRIVTFIKLNQSGNRFSHSRFDKIKETYNIGIHIGEINNKMYGKFDITN